MSRPRRGEEIRSPASAAHFGGHAKSPSIKGFSPISQFPLYKRLYKICPFFGASYGLNSKAHTAPVCAGSEDWIELSPIEGGPAMIDARRFVDDPDMPECVVTLVDALGTYIRVVEDEFEETTPTLAAHIAKCTELLNELKGWEINPSLFGMRHK
jgi:hypothetical protein